MSDGRTSRSRNTPRHKDIDPSARRYFVYRLDDEDGTPVYIGRSSSVVQRMKVHADKPWFTDVHNVTMVGPFTWDHAVREERRQIEQHQPRGNVALTIRGARSPLEAYGRALAQQAPPITAEQARAAPRHERGQRMNDITWPAPEPKPEHPARRRIRLAAESEAELYRGRPLILCTDPDVEAAS